ncbi:MAG: DUF3078 domain-containing protein [Candidatus Marinimicrobia bacterium]|nr:DUF3078 domain-containing protein [Candidatus Neomarinimicrobiota bacterium]MCF7827702.1 DUF3078 domain-containing protein [Candidatus Neomarinimicrobiota bacterium]MCF7881243.1 DUF3078 domain-containing protein [Candidatus Neomarinimicrobiota bacterium]
MNMIRIGILSFLFVFSPVALVAQEDSTATQAWENAWGTDLTFAHTSFDNWSKGGRNTLSLNWYNDMRFTYEHEKSKWRNTAFYVLDYTRVDRQEIQKTDDRLELESIYSFTIKPPVDPYAALTMKTQLLPGYNYVDGENTAQNSAFFDPGYVTQSLGFTHAIEEILVTRAGYSVKETFAPKYAKEQMDDSTDTYKIESGLEFVADYSQNFSDNVEVKSKFELFSDLKALNTVDVFWKNYLAVRFRKNITLQFQFTLWYDRDIDTKRQIKESTTVGLHYAIF